MKAKAYAKPFIWWTENTFSRFDLFWRPLFEQDIGSKSVPDFFGAKLIQVHIEMAIWMEIELGRPK